MRVKKKELSKEAAQAKERKILQKENEASKKRMAEKKAKRGYKMVNPVKPKHV